MLPIRFSTGYPNCPHLKDGGHLHLCIPGSSGDAFHQVGTPRNVLMGRKIERRENREGKGRNKKL